MEKQIIEQHAEWDRPSDSVFAFMPAVLKIDIGDLKKGTEFNRLELDIENNTATLLNSDPEGTITCNHKFSIQLTLHPIE